MSSRPTRQSSAGIPGVLFAALYANRHAIARTIWVALAVLAVAVFAVGLPAYHAESVALTTLSDAELAALHANLDRLGISVGFYSGFSIMLAVAIATAFFGVAALIFWRRSDDPMALYVALLLVLFGAMRWDANEALARLYPSLRVLSSVLESLSLATVFAFFYVFPDGRFVPRWTRWLAAPLLAYLLLASFAPGSSLDPKGWSGPLHAAFFGGLFIVGVLAQVHRYRRLSGPVERQQTKWVVFGFAAALASYLSVILVFFVVLSPPEPGSLADFAVGTLFYCSTLSIPLALGVAIMRYRLWDIDVIINRTLVYGALSVSVIALYVLLVGGIGALLEERATLLASLLATGIAAVAFAPLRERLQRGVNRLMYGERDDPYEVLSRLGQRLGATIEPGAVLPTIVETVAGALKLPYAAIEMKREDGFRLAASHGASTGEEATLPLKHGGEIIGRLVLAPRAPGEGFSPADRRLLEDLARNAEAAVHAVRLTNDLRLSRERIVTAREEERRRLRRDLHDGLGPTLGGLTLGLDVSRKLLASDPQQAGAMIEQLKAEAKDAVADVRRLVYGLRPPALDDLGLVGAIREQAARHGCVVDDPSGRGREGAPVFLVEAPAEISPLSAAVEVACYRIAQEALTNVVRHARAGNCRVKLSVGACGEEIELEIEDDGVGMPEDRRAGVGMSSMSERAEELGGTLTVGPAPGGGTRVSARLPLFEREGEHER